jgi:hypothetical protein
MSGYPDADATRPPTAPSRPPATRKPPAPERPQEPAGAGTAQATKVREETATARAQAATGTRQPRAAEGAARAGTRAAAERDPFFDNAKYLAIVLVAMGHSWEPLQAGSRTVEALYITVYAFHMPAFIIISGCFSRGFEPRPGAGRAAIRAIRSACSTRRS